MMDELIKMVKEHLREEEHDVDTYHTMASMAYEHDHEELAQVLNDIAYEESIHAKHLSDILMELGN